MHHIGEVLLSWCLFILPLLKLPLDFFDYLIRLGNEVIIFPHELFGKPFEIILNNLMNDFKFLQGLFNFRYSLCQYFIPPFDLVLDDIHGLFIYTSYGAFSLELQ